MDLFTDYRPDALETRHGAPAEAFRHMASYESDDGKLVVFDFMVGQHNAKGFMLFSRWYGTAAVLAPDGLAPLHHSPDAWWGWRPKIHSKSMVGWTGIGSQTELGWRYGLAQAIMLQNFGDAFTMTEAEDRAHELLVGCLSAQQRLELAATRGFRVRGAKTGNLYRIELGNGFEIVDKRTGETVVSYCLHTEGWLPHEDVALATKFALEDPELEVDCLENARATPRKLRDRATAEDLEAARLEETLIA